ncbi:MAG: 4Fe-4S binding protein [Deltaproteobacteria bacterium]|nr:4Fe-4S binding protein [Deltaproteobacteria bacterium]
MYSKMLVLRFPRDIVNQPIVCNLVRNYDLTFNILKATVYPHREGLVVMELQGQSREDYDRGIRYLKRRGVKVDAVAQDIQRDLDRCFQCGACTAVCPTGALYLERPSMEVLFDPEKCSACELCVKTCPTRAMIVTIDKAIAL